MTLETAQVHSASLSRSVDGQLPENKIRSAQSPRPPRCSLTLCWLFHLPVMLFPLGPLGYLSCSIRALITFFTKPQ